jgi:SNF2 family DNA or RNA helicase
MALSVVFSFWTKMLDLIQRALHSEGFGFQRIDGKTSLEGRRMAIEQFNQNPECTVMLASIGSAGEG